MTTQTRIEQAVINAGLSIQGWVDSARWGGRDERPWADLGEVRLTDDIDEVMVFEGAEGRLYAVEVGSAEHANIRVAFMFMEDGMDDPSVEIGSRDIMKVEPI